MAPKTEPNSARKKLISLPSDPGTYALILRSHASFEQSVGALGIFTVRPGFYIYVGSALGPGGIRARVSRHLRTSKKLHWHIDYLRQQLPIVAVWYAKTVSVHEHRWANTMGRWSLAVTAVAGFGASDCECESHLFFCRSAPSLAGFRNRLEASGKQAELPCIRSAPATDLSY